MSSSSPLLAVYEEVDDRVAAIRAARAPWPCQKGCDDCCRSLADIPRMTEPEWLLLRSSFDLLQETTQQQVFTRIRALTPGEDRYVCPMLDAEQGACLVYEGRPLACRTYGYYVHDRDEKWCVQVSEHLGSETEARPIMGNEAALERRLARAGRPARRLDEWFTPPAREQSPKT